MPGEVWHAQLRVAGLAGIQRPLDVVPSPNKPLAIGGSRRSGFIYNDIMYWCLYHPMVNNSHSTKPADMRLPTATVRSTAVSRPDEL